ncbi:class I SAM-dependent methyltransferase [uncultured Draconibacterium sp.]|uniref:class I SAM-dependent methyltransferase n=1 Tax=uncultured Draconibacterium sp. TaxID=1573823 RepID=UPI0032179B62
MKPQDKEIYWSRFANDFEEKQQEVVGKEILSLTVQEVLKEQNLGRVLELGCGTGLFTEALQNRAQKVIATDYSEEMIAMAKQKRAQLKNVEFGQANAMKLEFEDESFDTVFMGNLIHVIGNAEKVIQESKRVLKKGGLLIITSFSIYDIGFFSRMKLAMRYIKTFGKPSTDATKEKISQKSIEILLQKNALHITKSILLGKKSKAFYVVSTKI